MKSDGSLARSERSPTTPQATIGPSGNPNNSPTASGVIRDTLARPLWLSPPLVHPFAHHLLTSSYRSPLPSLRLHHQPSCLLALSYARVIVRSHSVFELRHYTGSITANAHVGYALLPRLPFAFTRSSVYYMSTLGAIRTLPDWDWIDTTDPTVPCACVVLLVLYPMKCGPGIRTT